MSGFTDTLHLSGNPDSLCRPRGRLSQENLTEEDQTLDVVFLGVLPHRRTFEFKRPGSDEVYFGKISPAVANPSAINNHLGELVSVRVMITRVGAGRPRYLLLALPAFSART